MAVIYRKKDFKLTIEMLIMKMQFRVKMAENNETYTELKWKDKNNSISIYTSNIIIGIKFNDQSFGTCVGSPQTVNFADNGIIALSSLKVFRTDWGLRYIEFSSQGTLHHFGNTDSNDLKDPNDFDMIRLDVDNFQIKLCGVWVGVIPPSTIPFPLPTGYITGLRFEYFPTPATPHPY